MSNPNFSHRATHQRHMAMHKHAVQTAHRADAQFRDSARRHRDLAAQAARRPHETGRELDARLRAARHQGPASTDGFLAEAVKVVLFLGWLGFMGWLIFAA